MYLRLTNRRSRSEALAACAISDLLNLRLRVRIPFILLHAKAAALLQSLAKNHGFIDGNKRVALLAVATLLSRSGAHFVGENVVRDIEDLILALVENQESLEGATRWFKDRIVRG